MTIIEIEKKEIRLKKLNQIQSDLFKSLKSLGLKTNEDTWIEIGPNYVVFKSISVENRLVIRYNSTIGQYEITVPQMNHVTPNSSNAILIHISSFILNNQMEISKILDQYCNQYNQLILDTKNGTI